MGTLEKIDLSNCSIELGDDDIVVLYIYPEEVIQPDKIREMFKTIHERFSTAKGLLVTSGDGATLSPEARDLASSAEITDQILVDAIVPRQYSQQMAANFFLRYNRPHRPTRIFRTEQEAREWLVSYIAKSGR